MTSLSIIILSFNTKELTTACIDSLFKQYSKQLASKEFEIIVVDNASTDGTIEHLKNQKWPNAIQLILNKENTGFAKGCNIGVENAKGTIILLLNSDTQTMDDGIIGMVSYLQDHKNVGILGAKLLNPNKTPQSSAGTFYNLPQALLMLLGGERFGALRSSPNSISNVDWVSGGSMMVKKEVFERLHGFDEDYFMYVEDMDLCFRAKKIGYFTYFYPSVTIIHREHGSGSRSFAIVNIYKGLLVFYKKNKSSMSFYLVKIVLFLKAKLLIGIGRVIHNTYLVDTYEQALKIV